MKKHTCIGNYVNNTDTKKPIYCSLAFGSASINAFGEYIPCCNIRTDHWKMYKDGHYDYGVVGRDPKVRINAQNLRELRGQLINGEWPDACLNCKQAEENDIASMRTIWNKNINDFVPMNKSINPTNIKYLDLTFGTKCNSKCMTCSSILSDFWEEEWNDIWRIQPEQKVQYKRVSIDNETAQKLVDDFPNVEFISLVGGEPTISEEHIKFLKLIIATGRAKKIRLSYVTNLTGISDELIDIWNNFGSVHVSVSIDGYKQVNEYIRYPFKWSKVESNLRTYVGLVHKSRLAMHTDSSSTDTKFTVGLSCTISLFNAIDCVDLLEFWYDLFNEFPIIMEEKTLVYHASVFANRVSHPEYSLISLLTPEYKQLGVVKAKKLLDRFNNEHPNDLNDKVNSGLIDTINIVIKWLEEPQIVNSTSLSQLKHFITESDQYRNRKLQDSLPLLWDELHKIWDHGIIPGDFYIRGKNPVHGYANSLIDGPGYVITDTIIGNEILTSIESKLDTLYPVRASSSSKQYAERDDIKNLSDISVWWSQSVLDWPEVQQIDYKINMYITKYLKDAVMYSSDIVTINAGSTWISPHIDTPNRFDKWNTDKRLLGVQVIIPLDKMGKDTAGTGIVPHSQKMDFDINKCYNGDMNVWFLQNYIQPDVFKGNVLIYNTRLLHSSMPNPTSKNRPVLLINYLHKDIIDEVRQVDNIWKSNE